MSMALKDDQEKESTTKLQQFEIKQSSPKYQPEHDVDAEIDDDFGEFEDSPEEMADMMQEYMDEAVEMQEEVAHEPKVEIRDLD